MCKSFKFNIYLYFCVSQFDPNILRNTYTYIIHSGRPSPFSGLSVALKVLVAAAAVLVNRVGFGVVVKVVVFKLVIVLVVVMVDVLA